MFQRGCPSSPKDPVHTTLLRAMVTIGNSVLLKYNLEAAVTIPDYLLVDGPDGHKYLRMRPSSLPIVQLLTGSKHPHRCSLVHFEPFHKLIELRNEQMDRYAMGNEEEDQGDQLFESQAIRRTSSRKKIQNLPDFVNIHIGNTVVPVLVQGDFQRPKALDFMVKLDANLLTTIIDHVRANVEELESWRQTERPKKRAKAKASK